jgi:hypothetical protein
MRGTSSKPAEGRATTRFLHNLSGALDLRLCALGEALTSPLQGLPLALADRTAVLRT